MTVLSARFTGWLYGFAGKAFAYAALELFSRVLQSLVIFAVAARLTKSGFGEFYIYFSIYQLVIAALTGGLSERLMAGIAGAPEGNGPTGSAMARQLSGSFACRTLACLAAAWLAAVLLTPELGRPLSLLVCLAAAVGGVGAALVALVGAFLNCRGRNRQSISVRAAYLVLLYVVAGIAFWTSGSVAAFFLGTCAVGVGAVLVIAKRLVRLDVWRERGNPARRKENSAWFLVPVLLNWFFWYGLSMLVGWLFGVVSAAEIAFVNSIASALMVLNLAVTQAWLPRYLSRFSVSKDLAEREARRVYRVQSWLMLLAAVAAVVVYWGLSKLGIPPFDKYAGLSQELAIVVFGVSASSMYFSSINAYAVHGRGRRLAVLTMISYALSAIVLGLGVSVIGMMGVYVGLACVFVFRGLIIAADSIRKFRAGFLDPGLLAANVLCFAAVVYGFGK